MHSHPRAQGRCVSRWPRPTAAHHCCPSASLSECPRMNGIPVRKPGSSGGCSDSRGAGKRSEMEDVSGHPPVQEKLIRVRIQGDLGSGEWLGWLVRGLGNRGPRGLGSGVRVADWGGVRSVCTESSQHEEELNSSVRKVTLARLGYWPPRCWHDGPWMEWLW